MAHEVETTTQSRDLAAREKAPVSRESTRPGAYFRPDVDIVERPEAFVVTADLPGVDEQHVHVHLEQGVLTIEGELAVLPDEGWKPLYAEYRLGGYHRQFRLTDRIDAKGIRATMRDGVLELHLPKVEEHKPRTIQVTSG